MLPLVAETLSGAVFSAALLSAGVYAPSVIRAQMTFASNAMLSVMMGASATSAIVFDLADRWKIVPKKHREPSEIGLFPYDGNVIGGALIGVGMAVTGSCPGTAIVQMGLGMPTGLLVGAGGILGGYAFVKLQPTIERNRAAAQRKVHAAPAEQRPLDIATKMGISPLLLLLVWVPMCLTATRLFFATDRSVRQASSLALVSPAYGGFVIGLAQLTTTLLTHHAIGASSAFEDIGRWLNSKISHASPNRRSGQGLALSSVAFSIGMVGTAAAFKYAFLGRRALETLALSEAATSAQCLFGGFAMVIGARVAGGCTSGHGISGLAKFSLSSLVTTVAMFSAGIVTAQAIGY